MITSKAASGYHFKTGQRKWPSRTENVLSCRLLWWQVGFVPRQPRLLREHQENSCSSLFFFFLALLINYDYWKTGSVSEILDIGTEGFEIAGTNGRK